MHRPTTTERDPVGQRLLRAWANVALAVFYRDVSVIGTPPTPGQPVILAANHSNALGDVAILIDQSEAFPRFLAAATWWRHLSVRGLFRLGRVLPVARRADAAAGAELPFGATNGTTFAACYEALADGDLIAIFPEGRHNLDVELLPFKTGAARIGVGAAADAGVDGVTILPSGLAYQARWRFRSDAVICFGEPIAVDEFADRAAADPEAAVREITRLLQVRTEAAIAAARAALEPTPPLAADEQHRKLAQLALLTPPAAVGTAVNAPGIAASLVAARAVGTEAWQATAKAVSATLVLPLAWAWIARRLSPRWGSARAWITVIVGAACGRVSLAWLDRAHELSPPDDAFDAGPVDRVA